MSTLLEDESNSTDNRISNGTTENIKYHYDPVPSDCKACAARLQRQKYEELEIKRKFGICKQLSDTTDVCYSSNAVAEQKLCKAKLHIVVTNKRVKVYGKWDKEKLLALLIDRLLQRARTETALTYEKMPYAQVKPILIGIPLHPIIHRGIYSERILKELHLSGMTEHNIIRAMKFGICNLEVKELYHFRRFGVTPELPKSQKSWSQYLDEALIENLNAIGLNDRESFKIVMHGIISRRENCLMKLSLAGIDISGILNWQGPVIPVCTRMIGFLRKIGIDEDVLQLIVQKGIDEETLEMLRDLGYTETEEEEHPGMKEVITCECSLTIPDTGSQSSVKTRSEILSSDSSSKRMSCICVSNETSSRITDSTLKGPICNCYMHSQEVIDTHSKSVLERNDYLRQTVMVPLAWAMEKTLRYKPTDPKHYIAYQLLRWKYGNVSQTEMDNVRNFVIAATVKKDEQLAEQKRRAERELAEKLNSETLKNIPCEICLKNYQLHRIKKRCWKCTRKWIPKIESCEFAEVCSSCKLDLSDILKSETSSSDISQISICADNEKDDYEDNKSREHSIYEKIEQVNTRPNDEKISEEKICCPWPCELPILKHFQKDHL